MGARGYVAFDFANERRIVLATHWDGRELGPMLQAALREWPPYQGEGKLASLLHREMTKHAHDGCNSISPWTPGDADFGGFVVDTQLRTIQQRAPYNDHVVHEWTFDVFAHVPESEFQEAWLCA